MVVAILLAEMQGARKFIALKVIRENARSTGGRSCDRCSCPHGGRIEMFDPCWLSLVDAVTSRARAPLPSLVELANELLMLRAVGNLPRGRSAAAQTETNLFGSVPIPIQKLPK
jgi:hypothetical protein